MVSTQKSTRKQEYYRRDHLPHFDGGAIWQSVTIHIKNSLPVEIIKKIKHKLISLPIEERKIQKVRQLELYLDSKADTGPLKNTLYAQRVSETFLRFNGKLYDLAAFVVMSNHAHLLFRQKNNVELRDIITVIKSQSAKEINKLRGSAGSLWGYDYYDRYIRSIKHWYRVFDYIENNPVKAGLCDELGGYKASSAYYRTIGLLSKEKLSSF